MPRSSTHDNEPHHHAHVTLHYCFVKYNGKMFCNKTRSILHPITGPNPICSSWDTLWVHNIEVSYTLTPKKQHLFYFSSKVSVWFSLFKDSGGRQGSLLPFPNSELGNDHLNLNSLVFLVELL